MAPNSRRFWMIIIFIGLLSGSFVLRPHYFINANNYFLLYIAQLILDGGTQYVDMFDHNLPLASQILIPVAMLMDWGGSPPTWL